MNITRADQCLYSRGAACPGGLSRQRKRKYRRPGQGPLEMAGYPPGEISYKDTDLHVSRCPMRFNTYGPGCCYPTGGKKMKTGPETR